MSLNDELESRDRYKGGSPQQEAKRPGTRTRWRNLLLAGDWTATGLPATIEGAIRSGNRAAEVARSVQ